MVTTLSRRHQAPALLPSAAPVEGAESTALVSPVLSGASARLAGAGLLCAFVWIAILFALG